MLNIKSLISKYKYKFLFVIILMIITSLINTLLPYIIKQAISFAENATSFNDISSKIICIVVVYMFLSIICAFLEYVKYVSLTKNTESLTFEIREEAYKKVISFNMDTFSNMHISTLITRMTADINNIGDFIGRILPMFISAGIFLIVVLGVMCFINIYFALVMVICSLILVMVLLKLGKKMEYYNRKSIENTEKLNNYFGEAFSGINTINLFNIQKERKEELDRYNKEETDISRNYFTIQSALKPVESMTKYLIISIIIYLCIQGKVAGIDVGIIYVVVSYIDKFFEPLAHILYHYENLQQGRVSIKRIDDLLQKKENIENIYEGENTEKLEGNIRFKSVNFSYVEGRQILNDVTFSINKGEKVALIGETGAGKTTIINLILGFYKINSGNILFDGKNMDDISLESIRKNVSFIQQNPYIFDDTIKRNIIINNNNISDENIINILKQVGLYDRVKSFENGIYEKINDNSFSKGEKQLLAFARAIAKETSIYVFDEPTSNVDVESEIQLKKVIDNLSKDSTVIIIAHRPATIENVDKILKVEDGKVVQVK
ncbi:MAG: ABC transporter ATP-binding protein [Clostridia bacterium]|nr:xenobiotic-transporting ATPase [Clostridium sp. CAG:389]